MSDIFKEELDLTDVDFNFHCTTNLQGEQTAKILTATERQLTITKPDMVVVLGDTNTTLAGALAAVKLGIPIAHIEAGCRCFDMKMPEEINRRIVDAISSLLFAPTEDCVFNLIREGADPDRITIVGYTQGEVCRIYLKKAQDKSQILEKLDLKEKCYILLTVHRQENADVRKNLEGIVSALPLIKTKIVFPVHPRTRKRLQDFGLLPQLQKMTNVILSEPLGFFDFMVLLSNAKIIVTDSGGVHEESAMFKVPSVILRERTELRETIAAGVSVLAGARRERITEAVNRILDDEGLYKQMVNVEVYPAMNSSDLIVERLCLFCRPK
jgi:UDP-N-acetylglucosamine 2-epimerase (non-hydrolysing)